LTRAAVAFDIGDNQAAERIARDGAERARKSGAAYYETRSEALLARVLLAEGRAAEGRRAAARAMSIRQTPVSAISRLEARFADLTTAGAIGRSRGPIRRVGERRAASRVSRAGAGNSDGCGRSRGSPARTREDPLAASHTPP